MCYTMDIINRGGGVRFHHIPQQLFFLRCWATRLGTFLSIVVFQRSRSPEGRGGGLNMVEWDVNYTTFEGAGCF